MPTFARSKPNSVTHCDGPAARPQRAGKPSHGQAEERPARQQRSTPLARTLLVAVRGYQVLLSPLFGGSCRYLPSCSQYMAEAVRRHGAVSGGWLGLCRLARCHPLGSSGFDPVPDQWPPARVACCSREDLPGASLDSGVALSPSSGVPGGRLR